MVDIKDLKIGDTINHYEYGNVKIIMLQIWKGYDFIGFEHDGNYHKDIPIKFFKASEAQP